MPLATSSQDGVVIEGGPNAVQISDRDGKPEVTGAPVSATDTPARVPAPVSLPQPEAMVVSPIPNSDVEVLVPIEEPESGKSIIERQQPGGEPRLDTLNVEKQKRLTMLENELELAASASMTRAVVVCDFLFASDSERLAASASPYLKDLAEYARLGEFETIDVHYQFDRGMEDELIARERASELANEIRRKLGENGSEINILDPEPITEPVATTSSTGPLDAEVTSVVSITMR
ncbi:MAG: hypothetical protein P1U58_14440 [Verrucomicrobiales bacterium]|nr:hypothetical protein [Verrucomicrobiales bacterium]